jgi:hypothetical protein
MRGMYKNNSQGYSRLRGRLDIGNFTEGKVIDKGTDQHWILPSCKHKQNADNNSHLQAQYHLIIT